MVLALAGGAVLAAGVVARVFYLERLERRSAVAEAAANATPEVAALLYEADDVACQLLDRYPDDPNALDTMAALHARFGREEDALDHWERCLESDSDFLAAYQGIGLIAQENGDYARATDCFRRATLLDPASSRFPVHLARSLVSQGKLKEAVRVLEKAWTGARTAP